MRVKVNAIEHLPESLRREGISKEFEVIRLYDNRFLLSMPEGHGHQADTPVGVFGWWIGTNACQVLDDPSFDQGSAL